MGNFSNLYSKHILIRGKIMETWFDVKIVKLSFFRLNASRNKVALIFIFYTIRLY